MARAEVPETLFDAARAVASGAPLAVFLAGTFLWAWTLWGYWIPAMPPGGLELSPAFLACAIGGGLAPSLSAILVAWLIGGGAGVSRLLAPLARWRVAPGCWLIAVLLVPALTALSVAARMAIGDTWRFDPAILPVALVWPLLAALGEEIGWRGFMQPRLQARLGGIGAALAIGLVWGLWHLPADWIGLKAYGDWFWPAFLVNGPVVLTAHAIILAWLWNRSGGSLAIAVVYHLTITASAMLAPSSFTEGATGVLSAAIGAAFVWAAATVLLIFRSADFTPAASGRSGSGSA